MKAIYKREMKNYMTSMTGAIAIAVMLFVVALMFRYINLVNGYATFAYTASNSVLIFYIVVPVLSMRVFAEERKQKTDQLLMTAPVSLKEIVFGKYLALISIFAIPVVIMCFYPLMMMAFGTVTLKLDYLNILAFFIMGCAYLSVGMFISSLTESVIISAIVSILYVFVTQMISNTYSMFSSTNFASLLFLVILSILLGLLVYLMTKNYWAALGTTVVLAAACFITYLIKPSWFGGKTEAVLKVFDFNTHFSTFTQGSFSISDLLFFVSVAVVGIVLTMQSVAKRRWS